MKIKSILGCAVLTLATVCGGFLPATTASAENKTSVSIERIQDDSLNLESLEKDKLSSKDDLVLEDNIKLPSDEITILPGGFRPGGTIFDPDTLPSEYCMRDEYILYAQNQDKHGYCWNYAATMAAATTIMKATNEFYDFSELWTGVAHRNSTNYTYKMGGGGSFSYQYNAMQRSGLMLETDLPLQNSYLSCNENAEAYYDFYRQYANDDLSNCLVYDSSSSYSRSDVSSIKRHLLDHGSLYMAFSFRTGFLKEKDWALTPNQTNTTSSHAISIIGWDDNYEQTFDINGTPTTFKGAWMVLNSYTERNSWDGIGYIFYNDNNLYEIKGYRYKKDTKKDFYFYDKIESGYAYPTNVVGKYYSNSQAQSGATKQLNIFYDDVNLEYSYEISKYANIESIDIYLDNINVTDRFDVRIDSENKRFYISKEFADYGQYKVLVTYGDGQKTDVYLNNFFVTHGLVGEEVKFDYTKTNFTFNPGMDLEYFSFTIADKNYAIYTNQLQGSVSFQALNHSIYSDKNMSIPTLSYEITDGKSCTTTYTITANSGYKLNYTFHFIYAEDTTLQPVNLFYDLNGGVNNPENYRLELANATTDLLLYEPTRLGYTFTGWYLSDGTKITQKGDLHYLNWKDIQHLGENPTLFASSHYKNYYNNSNMVFLEARWEKQVEFRYSVNEHVVDHYVSADKNATSGEKGGGFFDNGQTIYLFVKKPADTKLDCYTLEDGFEMINEEWARKAIQVNADCPYESVKVVKNPQYSIWDSPARTTFLATVIPLSAIVLVGLSVLLYFHIKAIKRKKKNKDVRVNGSITYYITK